MPTANAINVPSYPSTALDRTPPFLNFASPLHATFEVKKLPGVNFSLQSANIPSLTLAVTYQHTPLVKIPKMGDHIDYEPLQVSFKVDEELDNYIQVHNWIRRLGFPESTDEFALIKGQSKMSGLGEYSDASLMIRNSNRNVNFAINYIDMIPISLSSLIFDTTNEDIPYITAVASFAYSHFDVERI